MKNIYFPSQNVIILKDKRNTNTIYITNKKLNKYNILDINKKIYMKEHTNVANINTFKNKKFIIESK